MLDKNWPDFNQEFYSINDRIGAKIYNFIKNENPSWSSYQTEKNIEMGWGDPRFIEWIENNPRKKPDEFRLPDQIRDANAKTISNFKDLRALFNKEIRFKGELYNIIKLIKKSKEAIDFNIEVKNEDDFRKSYEIYTDVDWFKNGVTEIIKYFHEFSEKSKKIEIELKKIDKRLIIEITHVDSYPDSDSISSIFDEFGVGHLSRIKTKFRSVCDWAIESKFKDGAYRLNYLRSDDRKFKEKPESDNINGFKHILTFYEITKND
ncbi:hypothetical protein [Lutibacter sp.]|uniref:hypothetical protein n=1 Tax=Lutibacter sp. TaxID=1925666 RepID=UPI001A27839A|nr:hypothetical protein [Lutibacter sp.]MBI9042806.1 hypothetical protein [Lutibacter sp.]